MPGAMKYRVLRRSSSIVSRARCAGLLSCWKVNTFPETRSDVNKNWTCKDKEQDYKDQDKDKD